MYSLIGTAKLILSESFNRRKWNQPHQGAHLQIVTIAVRQVQKWVIHCMSDVDKVLEKFARSILIGGVFTGKLQPSRLNLEPVSVNRCAENKA